MNKINYDKHDWIDGEPITETLFDNIESGIGRATSSTNLLVDRTNQEEERLSTTEGKIEHQDMEFDIAIGEHDTLDERLKADVSRFVEVWSGGNYMSFEGKNIRIDNSKVGWIRDFSMKGETYQDPNNLSDIQSAGDLVDGKYKIEILSHNENLLYNPLIEKNCNYSYTSGNKEVSNDYDSYKTIVKPNTQYSIFPQVAEISNVTFWDNNNNFIEGLANDFTFITPSNCCYIRFAVGHIVKNVMLNLGIQKSIYIEPKQDKTQILLDEPLMKLSDGVYDEIVNGKLIRRVGKVVLNGSEDWIPSGLLSENCIRQYCKTPNKKLNGAILCDRFVSAINIEEYKQDNESCYSDGSFNISIFKNRLATQNIDGFKQWLSDNPTTVYYELAEPIETKLDLDMSKWLTYQDVTYFTTTCNVQPTLSLKALVDIQATVSNLQATNLSLRRNNQQLEQENQQAEKELNTLQEQCDQQTADLLDMDMRVLMLEE